MKYASILESDYSLLAMVYNQNGRPRWQCPNVRYVKCVYGLYSIGRSPNTVPEGFGIKDMGDEYWSVDQTSSEGMKPLLVILSFEINITCSLLTTPKDTLWWLVTKVFGVQPWIPPIYSHTLSLLLTDTCTRNTLLNPTANYMKGGTGEAWTSKNKYS